MGILPELFFTFAKIGAFTFGGGYAMISLIDHECVEKKRWITSDELTDMTVIAESTPGPVAINCATYTGYKKAGFTGAVIATLGMVLPSFFMILVISAFFERMMRYRLVAKAFGGIRAAVSILIMQTAVKMLKKMMKGTPGQGYFRGVNMLFAMVSFGLVFACNMLGVHISTIYLILAAGLLGFSIYALPKGGVK